MSVISRTLLSYDDVLRNINQTKPDLLIGCGFSAGYDEGFCYSGIKKSIDKKGSKFVTDLFSHFGTLNIEEIMKHLKILEDLHIDSFAKDYYNILYDDLFDAFIYALVINHGNINQSKISSAARFVSQYHSIFNLNFDLMLYYIVLSANAGNPLVNDHFGDGFCSFDDKWCHYRNFYCRDNFVFYLHGSLMFFLNQNGDLFKTKRSGKPIIEIVSDYVANRKYPYLISGGDSIRKIEIIKKTKYGRICIKALNNICGPLVLYGTSMSEVDSHIWAILIHNVKLSEIYFGVYNDAEIDKYIHVFDLINFKRKKYCHKPFNVKLFDSRSLDPWNYT